MANAADEFLDAIAGGDRGRPARRPAGRSGNVQRVEFDRERPERGLTALVLTVVELLRQLMERQALRRIEYGDLSEEQLEDLGGTLMALEKQMVHLREHFGLTEDDLNLDLGPLGPLLPRD